MSEIVFETKGYFGHYRQVNKVFIMQKSEIMNDFIDHVVDGMDMDCLIQIVKEYLEQSYQDMPDNEFFDMVKNESPYIVNFDF